jgi:HEPN domain-containing protein
MPHDPELVAETRAWLRKAAQDLGAAAHGLTARPPFLGDVGFHAQQAVEKSFKGFLTWHSTPFRRTHHIEEIGEQCLRIDPSLRPLVDQAVPLSKYAWMFRYPGEADEPSREQVEQALALAREVHEAVLARLPEEVHP